MDTHPRQYYSNQLFCYANELLSDVATRTERTVGA